MKLFSRSRGSQPTGGPYVSISMPTDADPKQVAQDIAALTAGWPRLWPKRRRTARQILVDALQQDDFFAQDPAHRVGWVADRLLLALDEAGLEITVKEEAEAPDV